MAERRWFGQALWWGREQGTWYVARGRRRFPLVRVTATEAEAYGNGTRPGWHFAEHPEQPGHGELGPWLGRIIRHGRALAEAWLLAPAGDRDSCVFAPSLINTLSGGGAAFVAADGQALSAWPMPWEARIEIRDRRSDAVGWVGPWFHYDDGEVSAVQWTGQVQLAAHESFHDICAELGRVLAGGDGRA